MNTNRVKLLQTLELVHPGLASRALIEQSDSFVFKGGQVHTYNDELSVAHPIDFHVEGAVRAAELFALLKKTKEAELDISSSESGLEIKGKKFKATIQFQPDIVLPLFLGDGDEFDWKDLPMDFLIGMASCLFSVGKDMSEPVLTCLHAAQDHIESCDRFRLTRYIFGGGVDLFHTDDLLIPATAAKELVKYNPGPVQYAIANGWIHFSSESGTLFSCRTYGQLKFPDLNKNLEVAGGTVKFPEDMAEIISRASIFAGDSASGTPSIGVSMGDGKIVVRGSVLSGARSESFEEWSRVRYDGEPVSFRINPTFLSSILSSRCAAVASVNRLKFSNDNFVHVVCTQIGGGE
jgi:hypothetical protein